MLAPMTEGRQPNLYVVAGPNGAGKSTFARLFLPDYADCREAVKSRITEHWRAGRPVYIWRDERVIACLEKTED